MKCIENHNTFELNMICRKGVCLNQLKTHNVQLNLQELQAEISTINLKASIASLPSKFENGQGKSERSKHIKQCSYII